MGAKAYASEWLDNDAKNLCRAPYKLISEKSIANVNHLGEATSSRMVWTITCERLPRSPPSRYGDSRQGRTARLRFSSPLLNPEWSIGTAPSGSWAIPVR